MRLFTAVELPEPARAALLAEQKRVVGSLPSGAGRLRLVKSDQLHLTLVFIGEVADERAAVIVRAMSDDLPLAPFEMTFGGIDAFPPHGPPRALYVGVVAGAEAAIALHDQVARRLEGVGVARETRPFRPHLTIGRWRESRRSDRPRQQGPAKVALVEVTAVTLFQSRISSSGPTYTRLSTARLVCP
jgi:2'-5' RNA ligase